MKQLYLSKTPAVSDNAWLSGLDNLKVCPYSFNIVAVFLVIPHVKRERQLEYKLLMH